MDRYLAKPFYGLLNFFARQQGCRDWKDAQARQDSWLAFRIGFAYGTIVVVVPAIVVVAILVKTGA